MYLFLYQYDKVLTTWTEWVYEQEVSLVSDTVILGMFAYAKRQIPDLQHQPMLGALKSIMVLTRPPDKASDIHYDCFTISSHKPRLTKIFPPNPAQFINNLPNFSNFLQVKNYWQGMIQ